MDPYVDEFKIISKIIGSSNRTFDKLNNNCCLSEYFNIDLDDVDREIFFIKKSFKGDNTDLLRRALLIIESPDVVFHPSTINKDKGKNNLVFEYLNTVISKMRLFKQGNICLPLQYCYFMHDNIPKLVSGIEYGSYVTPEPFTIAESEKEDLKEFIKDVEIPFNYNYLQLSFENFELSYEIQNENMQFLTLMNGLESLFHPSNEGELTYRLSRNTAVLLGENKENAIDIQRDMRELYRKRSAIVHRGRADISEEDLLKLRYYTRESIKEISKIDENKDDILKMLNECGFGERPWKNL